MVNKMTKTKTNIIPTIINAYKSKKTLKTVKDYITLMDFLEEESNDYLKALTYANKHYKTLKPMVSILTSKLYRKVFYGN
jgi:hypothetical protein